jgi:hypothetical protein
MERRWKENYRPLTERKQSVQDTAHIILTVLADSPERLTTLHIWRQAALGELRTRSYLNLLAYEGLVDKIKGTAKPHHCHQEVCRCYGWGITEKGKKWLAGGNSPI